ncbi:MAG: hypothetical protein Fur0043_05240 [Anaerolineales bacterium]
MSKYRSAVRRPEPRIVRQQHPIWRGIGCLIMVIVPIISYGIAVLTLPIFGSIGWLPYELTSPMQVPALLWKYLPNLAQFLQPVLGAANLKAYLALTVVYIIFLGGLMAFFYALLYQMFGPPRYGPLDAPPPRVKVKQYKR